MTSDGRPGVGRAGQRPRSSAACSTTRWSSGAASSAAPPTRRASSTKDNYGRDHHPRCFTIWMAGGGVKPGFTYGETDEFGYNVARDPVHVHDLQATLLHLLGIDHERLSSSTRAALPADRRARSRREGAAGVTELRRSSGASIRSSSIFRSASCVLAGGAAAARVAAARALGPRCAAALSPSRCWSLGAVAAAVAARLAICSGRCGGYAGETYTAPGLGIGVASARCLAALAHGAGAAGLARRSLLRARA